MLSHVRLVLGLKLRELRLLICSEELHNFGLDALVLDLHFDHGWSILGGQGAGLRFVKWACIFQSAHRGMVLVHLLLQRLQRGFFFLPDCLDLSLLVARQIEVFGEEPHHVVKVAVRSTMTVHALRQRGRNRQYSSGSDG